MYKECKSTNSKVKKLVEELTKDLDAGEAS